MSIKDGLIANKDYLSPDKESNSNWMSRVDGRRYLCDLAIPGSHDAATSTVGMLSEFAALTLMSLILLRFGIKALPASKNKQAVQS